MSEFNLDKIIKIENDLKEPRANIRTLKLLAEMIFKKRPQLFEILKESGQRSLIEYIQSSQPYQPAEIYLKRKPEFLQVLFNKITKLFDINTAEQIVSQFKKVNYLLTADHHGPLSHPFFINSALVNILALWSLMPLYRTKLFLFTFASSSVSLNNSSFPRGLIFHAKNKLNDIREHRISLLPRSMRMSSVYTVKPFGEEEIKLAEEILKKKISNGEIEKQIGDKILGVLNSIYRLQDILSLQSYSDQITKSNYYLWQKMFTSPTTPWQVENIYLDLESLIKDLLLKYHLFSNSPITKLLFDKNVRRYGLKVFDNIAGAYSSKYEFGTVFFWAIDKDKHKQLIVENDKLVSQDRLIKIPLTPESIAGALEKKIIMPNLLINFLLLAGYYGMSCFGGFNQVDYLTIMLEKWREFLNKIGEEEEAEINKSVPTKTLYGDLSLSFLSSLEKPGILFPASFLDLLIYKQPEMLKKIAEAAGRLSLVGSILFYFPDFYRILYPKNGQNPEIIKISHQDIVDILKLSRDDKYYIIRI